MPIAGDPPLIRQTTCRKLIEAMSLATPRPAVTDWVLPTQGITIDGWLRPRANTPGDLDDDDMNRLANWRFSHVRLPVGSGADGGTSIDQALDRLARFGLRAVVSMELTAAEQAPIWADAMAREAVRSAWHALASRVQDHPACLAFELLTDPDPPDTLSADQVIALGGPRLSAMGARRTPLPGATAGRAWSGLASTLLGAIREAGARQIVIVNAPQGDPASFAHLRPVGDPDRDGISYGFRAFAPVAFTMQGLDHGDDTIDPVSAHPDAGGDARGPVSYPGVFGGERWDRSRMEAWLAPALQFRETYRAPLYCGSFGVSAGAPRNGQLTWLRSFLGLCRHNHIGWAYAGYRDARFGLVCESGPFATLDRYRNGYRLDYDLLGVLQSGA